MMFVKTETILDTILAHKVEEVAALKRERPLTELQQAAAAATPARDFAAALHRPNVALIAEVKKASPSKGVLIENFDPVGLAHTYAENGAAALSVLTDEQFFMGHLDYLRAIRAAVTIPVLRKDFTIDEYQVVEARAAGADAVLLIAAALEDVRLADLHSAIVSLGMAALVEVHDETELERALRVGCTQIGINNRDLKTFQEDLNTTARIAHLVPPTVTLITESAIRNADHVQQMGELGAHAVLVGEGLVKAADIGVQVRLFSSQPRREA
ncbi:MAG: indole-3-glycerol phosphate synthase TrpC [Chloroflexota bacterium]|nr:indole-3-glycerol phosphate synthase TrpC [Chloroflexota bacterium]